MPIRLRQQLPNAKEANQCSLPLRHTMPILEMFIVPLTGFYVLQKQLARPRRRCCELVIVMRATIVLPTISLALVMGTSSALHAAEPLPFEAHNPVRLSDRIEMVDEPSYTGPSEKSSSPAALEQKSQAKPAHEAKSEQARRPGLFTLKPRPTPPQDRPRESVASTSAAAKPAAKTLIPRPKAILKVAFPELFPVPEGPIAEGEIPPAPTFDSPDEISKPRPALPIEDYVQEESLTESYPDNYPDNCVELVGPVDGVDSVVPKTGRLWRVIRCPGVSSLFHRPK